MASYRVVIKPSAAKELETISKKDRIRVADKILTLADDPRPYGYQKLSGQERYRVHQGVYRIIYSVEDVSQSSASS